MISAIIYLLFTFLIFDHVISDTNVMTNNLTVINHWISSNFGSSFAAQPLLYDLNHDGYIDIISVSVDGEVAVYDMKSGDSPFSSYWPVYLSNDHFFSSPIMFIHGENNNQEFIILTSQKGRIYYFDSNGLLVKTVKLNNIYLQRNWSFIKYKDLSEIISTKNDGVSLVFELYSEVYGDTILSDLSVEGVLSDLIIPVSFVTEESGHHNVIVSAVVVFNVASASVVDLHLISISRRESEYTGYLLSDLQLLQNKHYQLIATLTSGDIHIIQWNRPWKKFQAVPKGHVTYNQGPHNCLLTEFCRNRNSTLLANYLCCVYVDFYGHMAVLDLVRRRPMWEYKAVEAALPTTTKIFVDNNDSPFVVFANSRGWIYCISLLTGRSKESFPIRIPEDSFTSSPDIISNRQNQLFVVLLSDNGHLYVIPVSSPSYYRSVFHHPQMASYIPPILLQGDKPDNVIAIVHSKTGFIFKIELPYFQKKEDFSLHANINLVNPSAVGTLYGMGSSFSFGVHVSDPSAAKRTPPMYTVKVFINEHLYLTRNIFSTDLTITINLDNLNNTLITHSVFLFGTATIIAIDSLGRSSSPDHLYIRINYDFQFELIWILYLTFFICCAAILLFHFTELGDKMHLPRHINRDL